MNKRDSGKNIVKDSGKKRGQAHLFVTFLLLQAS